MGSINTELFQGHGSGDARFGAGLQVGRQHPSQQLVYLQKGLVREKGLALT